MSDLLCQSIGAMKRSKEECLGKGGWPPEEFKADSPGPVEIPEQGSNTTKHAFRGSDVAVVHGRL